MSANRPPTEADFNTLRPMVNLPPSVTNRKTNEHPVASLTVLTYNILAQDHIYRDSYPYCAKDTLKWKQRKILLSTELAAYDADIMCFQEMDRFHDHFQPLLSRLGYDTRYYMRNGPKSDVNCVCWKRNCFTLVESRQVSFEGTTAGLGAVPNVAQFCALQSIGNPEVRVVVATTHLYWRMECDHIRLVQLHSLVTELLAFCATLNDGKGQFIPIIAGDLNSDPDSMAVQAALRSNFLMDPLNFNTILERSQMSPSVLRQILSDFTVKWPCFYDAHKDYPSVFPGATGYPLPYTSFSHYKGILDFIMYNQYRPDSQMRITPTALRILPERHILEIESALPNRMFASDHLALMVEFTVFQSHRE
ncbi:hypothetical protein PSACC_03335 [Paramicrosporidium saccamoebae]|uniref:Endonuclease/exonuclease/phosphatase domain-containing protein n=1 Tax=Paramicrosporidium saccamoebae TaxID=1246581 RepID=A0A2H9TGW7_9FUNG|nr:hypothetical protein PSACC_03335 [Paramicrosporidium saccamoebae]